jgi:hypothetical protein
MSGLAGSKDVVAAEATKAGTAEAKASATDDVAAAIADKAADKDATIVAVAVVAVATATGRDPSASYVARLGMWPSSASAASMPPSMEKKSSHRPMWPAQALGTR